MIDWWVAALAVAAVAALLGFELRRSEQRTAATQAAFEGECASHYRALQRAGALRTELLAAQGALEDFGTHEDGCAWRPHMDAELDCTCGLVDAKERARKAVEL